MTSWHTHNKRTEKERYSSEPTIMQLTGTTTSPIVLIDSKRGCRAPVGERKASGTFGICASTSIKITIKTSAQCSQMNNYFVVDSLRNLQTRGSSQESPSRTGAIEEHGVLLLVVDCLQRVRSLPLKLCHSKKWTFPLPGEIVILPVGVQNCLLS